MNANNAYITPLPCHLNMSNWMTGMCMLCRIGLEIWLPIIICIKTKHLVWDLPHVILNLHMYDKHKYVLLLFGHIHVLQDSMAYTFPKLIIQSMYCINTMWNCIFHHIFFYIHALDHIYLFCLSGLYRLYGLAGVLINTWYLIMSDSVPCWVHTCSSLMFILGSAL